MSMAGADARTMFDRFSELENRLRQLRERHAFIERAVIGYGQEKAEKIAQDPEPSPSCLLRYFDNIFPLVTEIEDSAEHVLESIGVAPQVGSKERSRT